MKEPTETPIVTIAHRTLRNHSAEILRRVRAGETLRITNRGEVVAVLAPADRPLALRRREARVRGGFSRLARLRMEQPAQAHIDDLRGER
jgi:prevent-host-death family protein